ncbi:DUF4349 domain-containing protein [Chloroflexota bacterium]
MKKLTIGLVAISLILTSISCAQSPGEDTIPVIKSAPTPTPASPTSAPAFSPELAESVDLSSTSARMTVQTADMSLVVEDISVTIEHITALAQKSGGYVVSSRIWRDGDILHGQISFRVPADDLSKTLKALSNMAVEVTSQTTSSKDVTEEYTDLSAQLLNLQATEEQLLLVMRKAEKIEDILSVQKELSRVREDIERIKGRMQLLERTSETSLIQVSLEQSTLRSRITVNKAVIRTGESIRFNADVTGGFSPYSFEWDFGDKGMSTSKSPSHSYRSSGHYTVSLKVADDRGNTDMQVRDNYITVLAGWDPGNVVRSASHGILVFFQVIVNILIWLVFFSPVWLIIGIVLYFGWYRPRYKRRKQEKD